MTLEAVGIEVEVATTRSRPPASARSTCGSTASRQMADRLMWFKYIVKNVAAQARQDGDVHAEAALRRQRLGHAQPPVALEGRASRSSPATATRACSRWRSTTSAASSSTRRRSARSPTRHEQLPAAGAGLRGAGEPGVLDPQPLGVDPHPDRSASSPKAKRLEVRCPDPSCNPYLAFAAMMMAGLDGIQNKIDPGEPLDKDIYALSPEELEGRPADAGLARRGARRAASATTSSCSRATSSRPTSSTPGSTTSGRTRSTPSACARTRTSSRSTTTTRRL